MYTWAVFKSVLSQIFRNIQISNDKKDTFLLSFQGYSIGITNARNNFISVLLTAGSF